MTLQWSDGGDRLRRFAILIALTTGLFACADELAAPSADEDDDTRSEEPAAGDDDEEDGAPQGGGSAGPDAASAPQARPRDAGASTPAPSGPKPEQPEPLIDAGGPRPSEDAGDDQPFDPAETPADAGPPREDLGVGTGTDVVTIGDSWMDYALSGGGIEAALRKEGKRYRNYSRSGTTLSSGAIPGQFDRALRANPDIKTVIMTGGGNDVMFSGACNGSAERCAEAGAMIVMRLNTLWTKMAEEGVKDVVYIQYSNSAGTARMRPDGGMQASVQICTTGKIRCHSIPTSDIVASRDLLDGIHPNAAANTRIAKRVLEIMEKRGVRR